MANNGESKPWKRMLDKAMELHKSSGGKVTREDEHFKVDIDTVGQVFVYRKSDGEIVHLCLAIDRHKQNEKSGLLGYTSSPVSIGGHVLPAGTGVYSVCQADPYAELKSAYAAGKTIQCHAGAAWLDIPYPLFSDPVEHYRVKPEEEPATAMAADGWIKWNGGECPVAGETIVMVRHRNGQIGSAPAPARQFYWKYEISVEAWGHKIHHNDSDIVAYRVVKVAEQQSTTPDADGWIAWGGGPMPIGRHEKVDVMTRSGSRLLCQPADTVFWCHSQGRRDVVAYRQVCQSAQQATPANDAATTGQLHFGAKTVCQPGSPLESVANSITASNLSDAINRLATACATGDDGPVTAHSVLQRAANHMSARSEDYDEPGGERSMGKAVSAFNAITGRDLDESEGWLLLQQLKNVRLFTADGYHNDSAEDATAYTALMAEAKAAEAALDERLLNAAVADLTN